MRHLVRVAAAGVMLATAFLVGGGRGHSPSVANAQQAKDTTRVVMFDSPVNFTPGNDYEGMWGFFPVHVTVSQGETITFDNPAGNNYPHTVASITWSGTPAARVLTSASAFNSSPTAADSLKPGGTWTLDTTAMDPGNYVYYCSIHPWMTGTFTVTPAQ